MHWTSIPTYIHMTSSSLVDSFVYLVWCDVRILLPPSGTEVHTSPQVSQVVIFVAEWQSKKMDPRFPVGQARLETLGVLLCALIMALASCQVWNCVELILLGVNPLPPGSPPLLSASRCASLRPHHGGRLRPGVEFFFHFFIFPFFPPHGACLLPGGSYSRHRM